MTVKLSASGERVFGVYITLYAQSWHIKDEADLEDIRKCLCLLWDRNCIPANSYEYYHLFGLAIIIVEMIHSGRHAEVSVDELIDRTALFLNKIARRQFLWWQVPAGSLSYHKKKLAELAQYRSMLISEWYRL